MSHKELAIGFARSGLLGYGGGPSVIPLIRHEAVERFQWMSDEDFGEVLAMANALPGPIATKMAAYIGYHVKGSAGACIAIVAHILPTVLAMIGLIGLLYTMQHSLVIKGMIKGVGPVIGVMLAMMTYEFFEKACLGFGLHSAILLTVVSAVIILLGIHPAFVIALYLIGAYLFAIRKRQQADGEKSEES